MLTTLSPEALIPADHPIRKIRVVVDAVLGELDGVFDDLYASSGRSSVPPESLLKATVLMAMYSIRSERAFCERLNYDLLFKWFLDMRIDQTAFDASTFSKNRRRLLRRARRHRPCATHRFQLFRGSRRSVPHLSPIAAENDACGAARSRSMVRSICTATRKTARTARCMTSCCASNHVARGW